LAGGGVSDPAGLADAVSDDEVPGDVPGDVLSVGDAVSPGVAGVLVVPGEVAEESLEAVSVPLAPLLVIPESLSRSVQAASSAAVAHMAIRSFVFINSP
jgi:hypothetical protein